MIRSGKNSASAANVQSCGIVARLTWPEARAMKVTPARCIEEMRAHSSPRARDNMSSA